MDTKFIEVDPIRASPYIGLKNDRGKAVVVNIDAALL